MKPGVAWGAALVVAALGIGWLAFGGRRDVPARMRAAPMGSDAQGPAPVKDLGVARAGDPASIRAELEPVRSAAPELAAPADFEGLVIRVVLAATHEAVPGIDVLLFRPADLDGEGLLLARITGDDGALIERYARRYRTDEGGRAFCPRPGPLSTAMASARRDGLYGVVEVGSGSPDEVELELASDPELLVRVVDARRAPVEGVAVVVRAKNASETRELARATSTGNGIASLRGWHPRLYPEDEVRVGLDLLASEPVETPVDRTALPRAPIELVLPTIGRIAVELARADGGPIGPGFVVKLERTRREGSLGHTSFWSREQGRTFHRIARLGRAVFEPVALGLGELLVSASGPGFEASAASVVGPTAPGETVEVRLPLGRPEPLVVGRILRESGAALADTALAVHLILRGGDSGGSVYEELATDGAGVFRYALPIDRERPDLFSLALSPEEDRGPRLSASIELPGDLPPGETHVGDLVLSEASVLVAGVVVDEHDQPVRGASISCSEKIFWDEQRTDFGWSALLDGEARTGGDGRFEIRARSTSPAVFVDVRHGSFLALEHVETYAGCRDLRFVLRGYGVVAGRLLLDEGVSTRGIQMLLRSPAIPPGESPSVTEPGPGEFEFRALPAGTYTLECSFWPERRRLARIEGIEVEVGRTTNDPRLHPLDLRGVAGVPLRVFRIRGLDQDGHALPAFGIARRLPGANEYGPADWSGRGQATLEIATTSPALDLHVEAIGKRSAELLAVDGDREVVLGPGIPVRVVLAGERPALPASAAVVLSLHSSSQHVGVLAVHEAPLDASGGADLLVGDPGRYRLNIELRVPGAGGFLRGVRVRGGDELLVDVRDVREVQQVSRSCGPEAWRSALRELGIETD